MGQHLRVEVQFPPGLRVLDFEAMASWRLSFQIDPAGRPLDAVWEGGSIAPSTRVRQRALLGWTETLTGIAVILSLIATAASTLAWRASHGPR